MRIPLHIYIGHLFVNIYIIKRCNGLKIKLDKSVKTFIFKLVVYIVWYRYIRLWCKFMCWYQIILRYTQTNMCGIVTLMLFTNLCYNIYVQYILVLQQSDVTDGVIYIEMYVYFSQFVVSSSALLRLLLYMAWLKHACL